MFTNGVFDILHPGHVRYLQQRPRPRRRADRRAQRRRLGPPQQGTDRPINDEQERAEILAALECVDCVVIFAEDTPAEIIEAIQPDILVKGADWAEDAIVGRDTVEARGGRVVRVPVEQGFSTTAIIERSGLDQRTCDSELRNLPSRPTADFSNESGNWQLTTHVRELIPAAVYNIKVPDSPGHLAWPPSHPRP